MARRKRERGDVLERLTLTEAERSELENELAEEDFLSRCQGINQALRSHSVFSDPLWYQSQLTPQQRRYAQLFVRYEGDWERAAREAGYGKSLTRRGIEGSDAMAAYMQAVIEDANVLASVGPATIIRRLHRIALKAEERNQFNVARQTNKDIAELMGMGRDSAGGVMQGAGDAAVTISAGRGPDVYDAEYREVLESNGRKELARRLPKETKDE